VSFASYAYVAFLVACFVVHWLLPVRARKPFLVAMSYVFYGSWSAPFCLLLLAVSLFSWAYGLFLSKKEDPGGWLWLGVAVEVVPLLYFKYTNFAIQGAASLVRALGGDVNPPAFDIVLPLGISFFTFQGIAYLVDVATGERPFARLLDFLLFKAFWPQLIAGPIIRPEEIREQILEPRRLAYDDVAWGARRVILGLFEKMVLADLAASVVDAAFVPNAKVALVDSVVGIAAFGLQIYWDFSGYSSIAIGSARLFGYRFPENFDWPYASRSPQELWNRWHMTLSRWIRDYVFTPLTFASRGSRRLGFVWLVLSMAVCGLWHGAAATFVLWGVWHGVFLVLQQTWLKGLFAGTEPGKPGRRGLRGAAAFVVTLILVNAGWLLFRARSLEQVWAMARPILTLQGGLRPAVLRENDVLIAAILYAGLLLAQVVAPRLPRLREALAARPALRTGLTSAGYSLAIVAIVVFDREATAFVYFQF
jgi:alginate O-acetyltransferase complex protein AlgI